MSVLAVIRAAVVAHIVKRTILHSRQVPASTLVLGWAALYLIKTEIRILAAVIRGSTGLLQIVLPLVRKAVKVRKIVIQAASAG